jgi:hypothetical protein
VAHARQTTSTLKSTRHNTFLTLMVPSGLAQSSIPSLLVQMHLVGICHQCSAIHILTISSGATITVVTDSAVTKFSMIRYGTATHTVNTDQRQIPITPVAAGTNTYKVTLGPANSGQVIPGYWMLFALNAAGTPSKSITVLIKA